MKRETNQLHKARSVTSLIPLLCLIILFSGNRSVLAVDLIGPANTELRQWEYSITLEYSQSDTDFDLVNGSFTTHAKSLYENINTSIFDNSLSARDVTLKDLDVRKVYAKFSYGIERNWEVFLRLGGTRADYSDTRSTDSDEEPSFGGGFKFTFYDTYNLKLGCLVQANWSDYSAKLDISDQSSSDYVKANVQEAQVALGAKYDWSDFLSFYGGPVYRFAVGKYEDEYVTTFSYLGDLIIQTNKYEWDIEETSDFGGYIGAQIRLGSSFLLNMEYQATDKTDSLGAGIIWKF